MRGGWVGNLQCTNHTDTEEGTPFWARIRRHGKVKARWDTALCVFSKLNFTVLSINVRILDVLLSRAPRFHLLKTFPLFYKQIKRNETRTTLIKARDAEFSFFVDQCSVGLAKIISTKNKFDIPWKDVRFSGCVSNIMCSRDLFDAWSHDGFCSCYGLWFCGFLPHSRAFVDMTKLLCTLLGYLAHSQAIVAGRGHMAAFCNMGVRCFAHRGSFSIWRVICARRGLFQMLFFTHVFLHTG